MGIACLCAVVVGCVSGQAQGGDAPQVVGSELSVDEFVGDLPLVAPPGLGA